MKFFDNPTIAFVTLGFFFLFCGFDGTQQYLVAVYTEHDQQNVGVIALVLIYGFYVLGNFFAPWVIRSVGLRLALGLSALPYALFSLAAASGSPIVVYAAAVLLGLSVAVLWQASGIAVQRASSRDRMGNNSGLKYSALVGGGLLGIGVGALLLGNISSTILFSCYAAVSLVGVWFLSGVRLTQPSVVDEHKHSALAWPTPSMWLLLPAVFAAHIVMSFATSVIKIYAVDLWTLSSAGPIGTIMKVTALVAAPVAGRLGDRLGPTPVLVVVALWGGAALAALLSTTSFMTALFACGALGCYLAAVYPLMLVLIRSRASEAMFERNLACLQIAASSGFLCGYLLPLLVSAQDCLRIGVVLCAVVLGSVMLFWWRKETASDTR